MKFVRIPTSILARKKVIHFLKWRSDLRNLRASRRLTGFSLFTAQFHAMFAKRAAYYLRRWMQFIPMLIIPVTITSFIYVGSDEYEQAHQYLRGA